MFSTSHSRIEPYLNFPVADLTFHLFSTLPISSTPFVKYRNFSVFLQVVPLLALHSQFGCAKGLSVNGADFIVFTSQPHMWWNRDRDIPSRFQQTKKSLVVNPWTCCSWPALCFFISLRIKCNLLPRFFIKYGGFPFRRKKESSFSYKFDKRAYLYPYICTNCEYV